MNKDAFGILLALVGLAGIYAVVTGRVTITNGALAFNFGTPGTGLSVNRGSGTNNSPAQDPFAGTAGKPINAQNGGGFGDGSVVVKGQQLATLTLPALPQLENVNAIA